MVSSENDNWEDVTHLEFRIDFTGSGGGSEEADPRTMMIMQSSGARPL
jgi:hypothetical protein